MSIKFKPSLPFSNLGYLFNSNQNYFIVIMSRSKHYMHTQNTPPKPFSRQINHYGLNTPSTHKKTLIDQIISNCKMVQSPRPPLIQRPSSAALNNSAKPVFFEEKQNTKKISTQASGDKYEFRRNESQDKRNNSMRRYQTLQEWKPCQNTSEQYYIKKVNPKHGSVQSGYVSQGRLQLCKKSLRLRWEIQKQKQQHLKHCKEQERKLRDYFKEWQSKLNDIRNQELKTLNEYQESKLKEFDECMKETDIDLNDKQYEKTEKKLEELKKQEKLKVEENQEMEIKGCLRTGLNAMFFSFDQCKFN